MSGKRKGGSKRVQHSPKSKRNKKKESVVHDLMRVVNGILTLVIVVVLAGIVAKQIIPKTTTSTKKEPSKKVYRIQPPKPSEQQVTPKVNIIPPKKNDTSLVTTRSEVNKAQVAIIIDDLGNDQKIADKFLSLHIKLTFAILPFCPYSRKIAREAKENGCDVLLHLPMEPNDYPRVHPGPGVLLTTMTPDQLLWQLNRDIDSMPFLKGVNNHMGSKMTAEASQLYQIFTILKKRRLFFIDSRTTVATKGRSAARLLKVPFAERDIFIDHKQSAEFITKQLAQLQRVAERKGEAIGICHPHPITFEILRKSLKSMKRKVTFVTASQLVTLVT